jgi:hypothetical protein
MGWRGFSSMPPAARPRPSQAQFMQPQDRWLQPVRIYIVRCDQTANRECEISSTFGRSDLDHSVPMFTSDPDAVDRFARLTLQQSQ